MENKTFNYEYLETQEEVRKHIQECEGKHSQQVAYSSFHDALTQVCYGCWKVRGTITVEVCPFCNPPTEQGEKCKEELLGKGHKNGRENCRICNPHQEEEWEKEFDKKFGRFGKDVLFNEHKSFISQEIQRAEERVRTQEQDLKLDYLINLKEMILDQVEQKIPKEWKVGTRDYNLGFNVCRQEVTSILKTIKENV